MMFITVGIWAFPIVCYRLAWHGGGPAELGGVHGISAITPFMILHAFASGTTALTGVEAISNGITAFKEPRSKNAGITLIWMSLILGSLFLGISYLTKVIGAVSFRK